MMTGVWQDYVRRVLRMDEGEIELWNRIAGAVPTSHLRHIIQMMIRREREEMESLRMLLREHGAKDPGEWPRPPEGPPYPDYDPGYRPDPMHDPMPYTEKDKEGK